MAPTAPTPKTPASQLSRVFAASGRTHAVAFPRMIF